MQRAKEQPHGLQVRLVLRNIEVRFVKGKRLDEIGVALEDLTRETRDHAVAWEIRRKENSVGTQAFGTNCRHGGTYAETSRFIRGGTDDRAVAPPTDDYGLTA